jgi:hypothetical protein
LEPTVLDDLAAANVNRSYSLAATSIAIFTFSLIFLYPRYVNGEVSPVLFQLTLVVMAIATFSFVFSSFLYYGAGMSDKIGEAERIQLARRGDIAWVLGYSLLFAVPTLILFTVNLFLVGTVWLVLWLVYIAFVIRNFPRVVAKG